MTPKHDIQPFIIEKHGMILNLKCTYIKMELIKMI